MDQTKPNMCTKEEEKKQGGTEQNRTEQNRTEQNRTEQNIKWHSRARQDGTGQKRTEKDRKGQKRTCVTAEQTATQPQCVRAVADELVTLIFLDTVTNLPS